MPTSASGRTRSRYPAGDVYRGGFLNNKRHGQGQMLYTDGRLCVPELVPPQCCRAVVLPQCCRSAAVLLP